MKAAATGRRLLASQETGLVIVVVATLLGYDPRDVINVVQDSGEPPAQVQQQAPHGTPGDAMGTFVSKVLGSTEDVWGQIFQNSGKQYRKPTLVLCLTERCGPLFADLAAGVRDPELAGIDHGVASC